MPDLKEEAGEISSSGVAHLKLRDFRNYASLDLDLDPGFNVVAGPNAQGKTNLLEALYLLSTTRLLRGQRDGEAIRDGADRAVATAEIGGGRTEISLLLEAGIRKRATLNGLKLPRASDLIGRMPCVCVSSLDLSIVREEPADRRLFLDLELSAISPSYFRHLAAYKRALEQRNRLLKEAREEPRSADVFEPWETHLATSGSALRQARIEYVQELRVEAEATHAAIGDGESLDLEYQPKDTAAMPEALMSFLEATRQGNIARGATGVGPHRDDLLITVGGREARLYGSQGQQRTAVIALKFATLELGRAKFGFPPLLLLDDILSDLDARRRAMLVERVLDRAGQAVLTCTESAAAGPDILRRAQVLEVRSGAII